MIEVLAALSLSAAVGMRIALPLLLIGLLRSDTLWAQVPVLAHMPPSVLLGVLVSWSLCELVLSKRRLGQRVLQGVQLLFSPWVGAIAGMTMARTAQLDPTLVGVIGLMGGSLALALQLVQMGWFYRLRGLPLWAIASQDVLCVALVLLAFDAPQQGGLIALMLLWLAIRSSTEWRRCYQRQADPRHPETPRLYKHEPD